MRPSKLWLAAGFSLSILSAQAPTGPVLNPRGVINAFTQQPAPTVVAAGGIVWITGLNLGPPEGAEAKGSPLPKELGGVKVLINNEPVPLISVSPGKIVAQIPWEVTEAQQQVLMQLAVEVDGVRSRAPARFYVRREEPALRSKGDTGYGEIHGKMEGRVLKASGAGFGPVDPPVESGAAGPPDLSAKPRAPIRAYVGGIPAEVTVGLSADRVGEFDVLIEIPPDAKPGDVVQMYVNNRATNRLTFSSLSAPEVLYLQMPPDAEIRALTGSDLRGTYVLGSAARTAEGCYPSYVFDFQAQKVSPLDGCLTAANRNAATPFIPVVDGTAVSAFVGPPEGEAQQGISSKVRLLNPGQDPKDVELPGRAATLQGLGGNTVVAVMPGTPPSAVGIDASSGEVRSMDGVGTGAAAAAGAVVAPLSVDLGEGLNVVLTARVGIGAGRSVVVVGDHADKPTKAKLAILDNRNTVVGSEDLPEGFVPLVAPRPPAQTGQAQQQPQPVLAARTRVPQYYDTNTRTLYVLARKPDDSAHGFVAFTFAQETRARAIPFPEGRFAAACTANINLYMFELSRTIVLFATNKAETEFKQVCEALGYITLTLDLQNQRIRAIPLPGAGFVNVTSAFDLNDYLIGSNIGGARQPADTLDILDGVNLTTTRLQLPAGITSFSGLRTIGTTGLIVAPAQRSVAGDEGFVVFNVEEATAKVLPVPMGFASVQLVDVFTSTRKLLARGIKTGNTGAQYLLYDLTTTDLELIPNPPGVAWVGNVPAQAATPAAPGGGGAGGGAGPGQQQPPQQPQQPQQPQAPSIYQDSNPKANTVSSTCFDADRKPVGVMLVRLP